MRAALRQVGRPARALELDREHEPRRVGGATQKLLDGLGLLAARGRTDFTWASTASSAACRSPRGLAGAGGAHRFPPSVAWARISGSATSRAARGERLDPRVRQRGQPWSSLRSSPCPSPLIPSSPARVSISVRPSLG